MAKASRSKLGTDYEHGVYYITNNGFIGEFPLFFLNFDKDDRPMGGKLMLMILN